MKDRNGNNIRIGDRVCIYGYGYGSKKEGVVTSFSKCGTFVRVDGDNVGSLPEAFEVIAMLELEELVKKANEGLEAIRELQFNRRDEVEIYDLISNEWGPPSENGLFVARERTRDKEALGYRIKPKPKKTFTPFNVGKGWAVSLLGDRLQIGCRGYDVATFKSALQMLVRENLGKVPYPNNDLVATRSGIEQDGASITWEEAEKILKALEEVGA